MIYIDTVFSTEESIFAQRHSASCSHLGRSVEGAIVWRDIRTVAITKTGVTPPMSVVEDRCWNHTLANQKG